jgi:hypothetical protein
MIERAKSEVARLVCDGRWQIKHLKSFRTQFGDDALFDALFDPFDSLSRSDYTFHDQQLVGKLLLEFQPQCPIPIGDAIERSLNQWNRSVEELPWYLERCFGRHAVLEAIQKIEENDELTNKEIEELKTYRYWIVGPQATNDA